MLALLLDRLLFTLPSSLARITHRRHLRAGAPALVLVAKYPTAGAAKTRLAASGLGYTRAAEMARAMLLDLLARHARSSTVTHRVLLFAPPDDAHRLRFEALLREAGCADGAWTLVPIVPAKAAGGEALPSADLSAILTNALIHVRACFAAVSTVVFIGADAPTLGDDAVRAAIVAGAAERATLCPAEDGGYVLLGVPAGAPASIFSGVRWSASTTAVSQAAALARAAVSVEYGRTYADVDTRADYDALREALAADGGQRALCPRVWVLMERGAAAPDDADAADDDADAETPAADGADGGARGAARCEPLLNVSGEAFGIGGLDAALQAIARRVLATRGLSPALVARLGLAHTRGLLLHGPPGTGKTLAARALGKLLGCADERVRLVAGPELYNQYVGKSEANVRDLFASAEREQREYASDAAATAAAGGGGGSARPPPLHMLIFDEIDCLTARRADMDGSSGASVTASNVLSQLLSKLDGLVALNNVFVAGTTNRLDAIDEALLRPGRLELQLEIGLPDAAARAQILRIHTAHLRRERRLALDEPAVESIAALATNYTGAELEAAVRSAISHALVGARGGAAAKWTVGRAHLEAGLADVRPAFGDADGRAKLRELGTRAGADAAGAEPRGAAELRAWAVRAAGGAYGGGAHAALVRGAGCDGRARARARAAVAAALGTRAPLLRVISHDDPRLLCKRPHERADAIARAMRDAHRSALSCVLVEQIDRLAAAHAVRDGAGNVVRVDFDRELLKALVDALRALPRGGVGGTSASVCVLIATCSSDAVADALFTPGPDEDPLFRVVLDVSAGHESALQIST
jgi:SpoVK/Ycf46/Vps4 family AAA+-type ATPase/glycosyltransferase A (GT-A) superfamily protein (DUF2064 family)